MNGNVAFDGGSLGAALQFKRLCPSFKLEIPNSMENTTVEEKSIKNLRSYIMHSHSYMMIL